MNHETDLSTQQTSPQADYRISSAHENSLGPQNHQPPPQSRKKNARRIIFCKAMRLRMKREFQRVSKEGKRLVGHTLCLDCRPAKKARLGISASAKFGSAVERNLFKRQVREAFRQNYAHLPLFELNVIPRQCAKQASSRVIIDEFLRLLKSV